MTRRTTTVILLIGTAGLVAMMLLVAQAAPTTHAGFRDSANVLAFISGTAIGIERVIELMWTILGGILGTYWPLTTVRNQVNKMVGDLDTSLSLVHQHVADNLKQLEGKPDITKDWLDTAGKEITAFRGRFEGLKGLAPDNQNIQLLVAAASQNVNYLHEKYKTTLPTLKNSADVANEVINSLQNFLATFKDNPGRRLISLYVGAIMGLGVAGIFGLDLFQAVLQPDTIKYPALNIILTGLIIGLGSNPTHEVIRAVQEYKKGRKGENISKPDQPSREAEATPAALQATSSR